MPFSLTLLASLVLTPIAHADPAHDKAMDLRRNVVAIRDTTDQHFLGAGFVVGEQGNGPGAMLIMASACHVVDGKGAVQLGFFGGSAPQVGVVLPNACSRETDLALFLSPRPPGYQPVASSVTLDAPARGSTVYVYDLNQGSWDPLARPYSGGLPGPLILAADVAKGVSGSPVVSARGVFGLVQKGEHGKSRGAGVQGLATLGSSTGMMLTLADWILLGERAVSQPKPFAGNLWSYYGDDLPWTLGNGDLVLLGDRGIMGEVEAEIDSTAALLIEPVRAPFEVTFEVEFRESEALIFMFHRDRGQYERARTNSWIYDNQLNAKQCGFLAGSGYGVWVGADGHVALLDGARSVRLSGEAAQLEVGTWQTVKVTVGAGSVAVRVGGELALEWQGGLDDTYKTIGFGGGATPSSLGATLAAIGLEGREFTSGVVMVRNVVVRQTVGG